MSSVIVVMIVLAMRSDVIREFVGQTAGEMPSIPIRANRTPSWNRRALVASLFGDIPLISKETYPCTVAHMWWATSSTGPATPRDLSAASAATINWANVDHATAWASALGSKSGTAAWNITW